MIADVVEVEHLGVVDLCRRRALQIDDALGIAARMVGVLRLDQAVVLQVEVDAHAARCVGRHPERSGDAAELLDDGAQHLTGEGIRSGLARDRLQGGGDDGRLRAGDLLAALDRLLRLAALGHVPSHRLELHAVAVRVGNQLVDPLVPAQLAVGCDGGVLVRDDARIRAQRLDVRAGSLALLGRDQIEEAAAQQLVRRLAEMPGVGVVDEGQGGVGLEPADQIGLLVDDGAEPLLAGAQRILRPQPRDALGDHAGRPTPGSRACRAPADRARTPPAHRRGVSSTSRGYAANVAMPSLAAHRWSPAEAPAGTSLVTYATRSRATAAISVLSAATCGLCAAELGVHAGARAQLQRLGAAIEGPDARERAVEVLRQRLGGALQRVRGCLAPHARRRSGCRPAGPHSARAAPASAPSACAR